MIRAALIALALAAPAHAQDARTWPATGVEPSHVTIHAPTVPDAAATVTFKNTTVHGASETFSLTWGEITVDCIFDWNHAGGMSERLTVIAPAGFIAIPGEILVPEDAQGVVHIFEFLGG
jgi:hypothetical protein